METQTIQYPTEILSALGKEAEEFEEEARLLLALKYYETSKQALLRELYTEIWIPPVAA